MAGGGIAGAILSLRQNRALLHKRKLKGKEDVFGKTNATKLRLKQSTPQDMKIIRKKIAEYKRQQRKSTIIAILVALAILYFIYVLIIYS